MEYFTHVQSMYYVGRYTWIIRKYLGVGLLGKKLKRYIEQTFEIHRLQIGLL